MLSIWTVRATSNKTRFLHSKPAVRDANTWSTMTGQAECNSGPQKMTVVEVLLKVRP